MIFNICNLSSKYPYFNRAYVVSSGFGCMHLYAVDTKTLEVYKTKSYLGSFSILIIYALHLILVSSSLDNNGSFAQ